MPRNDELTEEVPNVDIQILKNALSIRGMKFEHISRIWDDNYLLDEVTLVFSHQKQLYSARVDIGHRTVSSPSRNAFYLARCAHRQVDRKMAERYEARMSRMPVGESG